MVGLAHYYIHEYESTPFFSFSRGFIIYFKKYALFTTDYFLVICYPAAVT